MLLDVPVSISSCGFAPFVFIRNYMGWFSHGKPSLHPWNGVHLVCHTLWCLPCYTQLAGIWPVYAPEWDWSMVSLDTLPLWVHSIHLKHCRSIFENPSCAPSQTSFFPAVGLAPYTSQVSFSLSGFSWLPSQATPLNSSIATTQQMLWQRQTSSNSPIGRIVLRENQEVGPHPRGQLLLFSLPLVRSPPSLQ